MSYDLTFFSKSIENIPSTNEIMSYFSNRKNYSINNNEAFYSNEDTGVYFSFSIGDTEPEDSESIEFYKENSMHQTGLSFNINYYRPHPFALTVSDFVASNRGDN